VADDVSTRDPIYSHTYKVGRLLNQLVTRPRRAATLGALVSEVAGAWFQVFRLVLRVTLFLLLWVVGLLIFVGVVEYTPRIWRASLGKYEAWQEARWVTDCAKYSEIRDCRRRYHELERD
jgi:hypothetical protein